MADVTIQHDPHDDIEGIIINGVPLVREGDLQDTFFSEKESLRAVQLSQIPVGITLSILLPDEANHRNDITHVDEVRVTGATSAQITVSHWRCPECWDGILDIDAYLQIICRLAKKHGTQTCKFLKADVEDGENGSYAVFVMECDSILFGDLFNLAEKFFDVVKADFDLLLGEVDVAIKAAGI